MPLPCAVLEHGAHGQHRAAEVAEHDHAVAAVGAPRWPRDERGVGAEAAVRAAAGGLDADVRAGHLRRDLGEAVARCSELCDTNTIPTTVLRGAR